MTAIPLSWGFRSGSTFFEHTMCGGQGWTDYHGLWHKRNLRIGETGPNPDLVQMPPNLW